jgi:hypothetical protein
VVTINQTALDVLGPDRRLTFAVVTRVVPIGIDPESALLEPDVSSALSSALSPPPQATQGRRNGPAASARAIARGRRMAAL